MRSTRYLFSVVLVLVVLALMVLVAWRDARWPSVLSGVPISPASTLIPTSTPTPGWWDDVVWATPVLPALPGLPAPRSGGNGHAGGERLPFERISCPTAGVQITDIRTAAWPWWHIFGTASIPALWYWKAEVSVDGEHWLLLYRSEQPLVSALLVRLNLTTLPAGPLQLRLTAVERTGNYPAPCVVQVGE